MEENLQDQDSWASLGRGMCYDASALWLPDNLLLKSI